MTAWMRLFSASKLPTDAHTSGSRPVLSRSRSLDMDSLQSPTRSPIATSKKAIIQVQPLESPAYISPSKGKLSNVQPGANTNTNKRGTRDRRGTIRASDFPPVPTGGGNVGPGGTRRTRSGTIVGPTGNRRERSGTVLAAARPTGLSAVPHAVAGEMDGDMQPAHDADVQMPDCGRTNLEIGGADREDDTIAADPMNIVGHWRDEDWPWTVAEPPSPECPRPSRAENRRRRLGLGRSKMPKGWELWKMREHDEDNGYEDPLNLLG